MRDYLVFAVVFGLLPFALKRPATGVMLFAWISLMNPHRLAFGAAYDFPFAALIAGATLIGLLATREKRDLPARPVTVTLLAFLAWVTFTSFFALEPDLVWIDWNIVAKTIFMVLVSMAALNTERDIRRFACVIGLSLAFWGLKGGIFTLTSGGGDHVYGPPDSFIADNNDLALALVTALPLIWWIHMQAVKKWMRLGLLGLCVFMVIAVVGTYSRGALLGGATMLLFLWLKSRKKITTGLIVLLMVPMVYAIMPQDWFNRMGTIDTYQQDASALGRINAWHFAVNVAENHILGGGFKVFNPHMFLVYAPEPLNYHAAHSIYFQVLGEQGPIGLIIYLFLMGCAWRTGTRILKFCKQKPELKWAADLAAMAQVSIIGFAVGGAFLSQAYFDLYFDIVAVLVVLEKFLFAGAEAAPAWWVPAVGSKAEERADGAA
jgi:putative inorganic carbon (HCO3(-)) transporter